MNRWEYAGIVHVTGIGGMQRIDLIEGGLLGYCGHWPEWA